MGLKVNLPHVIKQVARLSGAHGAALEQFEQHLRETIRGEHTLQELAETYCLEDELEAERRRAAFDTLPDDYEAPH